MSIRCFIAVELEHVMKRELGRLQARLRHKFDVGDKSMKWVRPENVHLTLKFLGDVEDGQIPDICRAVDQAVKESAPFIFELGNCGCFPAAGAARVLWVGILEGEREMEKLQQVLENSLQTSGFPPEGRKFSPHLTLARIKNAKAGRLVQEAAKTIEPFHLGRQEVCEIVVFQSALTPAGAIYTPLHRKKFEI